MGQKCYSSYPEDDVRSKLICVKSKLLSTGLAANLACLNRISNFLKEFDLCLSFYPWPPETPPPSLKYVLQNVGELVQPFYFRPICISEGLPTYLPMSSASNVVNRCDCLLKMSNEWIDERAAGPVPLIGKFSPSITNQIPQLVNKLVKLLDVKNIF